MLSNKVTPLEALLPHMAAFIRERIAPSATLSDIKSGLDNYFLLMLKDIRFNDDPRLYEALSRILETIPIAIEIRNEPWGGRHFAIVDPKGMGIDIVRYQPQS